MEDFKTCKCSNPTTNKVVAAIDIMEDDNYHFWIIVNCHNGDHNLFGRLFYKQKRNNMEAPTKRGVFIYWSDLQEYALPLLEWVKTLTTSIDTSDYLPGYSLGPTIPIEKKLKKQTFIPNFYQPPRNTF